MADDEDEWRFSVDEVGPDDPADDHEENGPVGEDASGHDADDEGWSVTMVGDDDDGPTFGVATGDSDESDGDGNVAGSLVPDAAVEPGTPSAENVAFATAGAILTALVFAALVLRPDPVTAAAIATAMAAGAALLYVFFHRF